jgi:hypothetical protein
MDLGGRYAAALCQLIYRKKTLTHPAYLHTLGFMRDYLGNTHITHIITFRNGKVTVRPRISWHLGGRRRPTMLESFMKCIQKLLDALARCGRYPSQPSCEPSMF